MDYSWSVKDLKNRLRRLEKLELYEKNEEEKSSLLIEIEDLRDDISQFTDQDKEFVEATLGEKLKYISDFLDDHSYAWDPCLTFAESTKSIHFKIWILLLKTFYVLRMIFIVIF